MTNSIKRWKTGNNEPSPKDTRPVYFEDIEYFRNKINEALTIIDASIATLAQSVEDIPANNEPIDNELIATDDLLIKTPENKTIVLERYVWRDEYPNTLVPAGGAKAPDEVDVTIGGVQRRMRAFDGANTEEIYSGSFEIPHDMVINSLITPELHVHWRPSTTGTGIVKLFFDWEYSPPEGAPIPMTTLTLTEEITTNNQYWHKLTSFGYIPQPSTEYNVGGKIGFNIRRTPSDVGDTYGADVYLEQIALHVPTDTMGSRQIYVK